MSDPHNPKVKSRTTPQWALYQREGFWQTKDGVQSLLDTYESSPESLERLAEENLTRNGWYYSSCNAGTSWTHIANRQAFYRYHLIRGTWERGTILCVSLARAFVCHGTERACWSGCGEDGYPLPDWSDESPTCFLTEKNFVGNSLYLCEMSDDCPPVEKMDCLPGNVEKGGCGLNQVPWLQTK